MAGNQDALRQQVARRNDQTAPATKPAGPLDTVAAMFKQMKPQLEQALPRHITADRLLRVALFTIRNNNKLLECDPMSLVAAVAQSAQLGLEPGILGHAYLVPYGKQVQFILGYKGMIELARRSGNVKTIEAHEVYENDDFEFEYGLEPRLRHKPTLTERGKVIAFYGVAHFNDGGYVFTVMSLEDVEKFRKRSRASDNGPWQTDYNAMALKTVIRRMFRWLPVSIELQEQLAKDGTTARVEEVPALAGSAIEIISYPVPINHVDPATGEVLTNVGDHPDELPIEIPGPGEIIDPFNDGTN